MQQNIIIKDVARDKMVNYRLFYILSLKRISFEDYGGGNYVAVSDGELFDDYKAYLKQIECAGMKRIIEQALEKYVWNAIYTLDDAVLTVTYVAKRKKLYISFSMRQALSKNLFYDEAYIQNNIPGKRTTLHMMEMWEFGNSFVIQLKNNHFLISDGGMKNELPYLLDYLESLVPEGEKPIIEGWFISHGHSDHNGLLGAFFDKPNYANRIYVEGFYYNEPSEIVTQMDYGARITQCYVAAVTGLLYTTAGDHPMVYRPQTGQRYYFNDITVDVIHSQEQLLREEYSGDYNDSSSWFMFTIEGQKCLFSGDGESGSMKVIQETYESAYLDVDFYTLNHHGFNTCDEFSDYCHVKTLLITGCCLPVRMANENQYLIEKTEEVFSWREGTKIFAFPYQSGESKTAEMFDWNYHKDIERPKPGKVLFQYTRSQIDKEVRYLRMPECDNADLVDFFIQQINSRHVLPFTEDGMLFVIEKEDYNNGVSYRIYFDKNRGWVISGINDEEIRKGIDACIKAAEWSEQGFLPREFTNISA